MKLLTFLLLFTVHGHAENHRIFLSERARSPQPHYTKFCNSKLSALKEPLERPSDVSRRDIILKKVPARFADYYADFAELTTIHISHDPRELTQLEKLAMPRRLPARMDWARFQLRKLGELNYIRAFYSPPKIAQLEANVEETRRRLNMITLFGGPDDLLALLHFSLHYQNIEGAPGILPILSLKDHALFTVTDHRELYKQFGQSNAERNYYYFLEDAWRTYRALFRSGLHTLAQRFVVYGRSRIHFKPELLPYFSANPGLEKYMTQVILGAETEDRILRRIEMDASGGVVPDSPQ